MIFEVEAQLKVLRFAVFVFVLFLKRKIKKRNVGSVYVFSLAFGCSTLKCKNNILEQEITF